ncbi:MAG: porin family protein [Pseudomonadales bacterium]|nr:porin family protein [Pseudomonadales bacterium]
MNKLVMLTAMAATLTAGATTALAEDSGVYGSFGTDFDERHTLNLGYKVNDWFSYEGSITKTDGDAANQFTSSGEGAGLVEKSEEISSLTAGMLWAKTHAEMGEGFTSYVKIGAGLFDTDIAYSGTDGSGKTSSDDWGYGWAAGLEYDASETIYLNVEYQRLIVDTGSIDHNEGGWMLGMGYKF